MRFPYQVYEVDPTPADPRREVERPSLKVRVLGLVGDIDSWGVLDTGADECVLPAGIFSAIGAAHRSGEVGIVADFAGRRRALAYGTVDLEIRIKNRPYRWHAKVAFVEDRDEAIWGRAGFLQFFNATFHGPERHFTLRLKGHLPPKIMPVA
jgi:hypothetical protein